MTKIAIVHNNVDQNSSIGKLAAWAVSTALDQGWHVTVVARDLDPALRASVEWRRLYVPPRLHAIQWAVARPTVKRALQGVSPDLLHVYQPQLAAIADTWHVEYLSRVAVETGSLHQGSRVKDRLTRGQQLAVAAMEDRYLKNVGGKPTVLFCSEQLRDHYLRIYGPPAKIGVLYNPAFSAPSAAGCTRSGARASFGLREDDFVVGYLGGVDERKGYREAISAVTELPDAVLLMAGPRSEGFVSEHLGSRLVAVGLLRDTRDFWAACDVLIVPSRFDPFAMVVTEAASNGVPVVVTPDVGASALVERHSAGEVAVAADLAAALTRVRNNPYQYESGLNAMVAETAAGRLSEQLVSTWHEALSPSKH